MTDRSVHVAPYYPDAEPLAAAAASGLVHDSTYVWGLFRSEGDPPDIWSALRRLSSGATWPSRLLVQTNAEADGIAQHRLHGQAARSVDAVASSAGATPGWHAAAIDGAEPFDVAIDADGLRWTEGALLQVAGVEVTPGLQWCLPPGRGGEGMWYRSRIFRVAGHLDGVAVDGFAGCDEVHLAPGRQNYVDDPLTATHLSDAWCTWATAYDDGSVEAGHAAFGRDGFGFGLRCTDGVATVTTDVAGSVTRDERGLPAHIAFDVDGEAWEFTADPRGLPRQPLPGPVRQAEGWFRRVGETRRPVVWCATPEVPAS